MRQAAPLTTLVVALFLSGCVGIGGSDPAAEPKAAGAAPGAQAPIRLPPANVSGPEDPWGGVTEMELFNGTLVAGDCFEEHSRIRQLILTLAFQGYVGLGCAWANLTGPFPAGTATLRIEGNGTEAVDFGTWFSCRITPERPILQEGRGSATEEKVHAWEFEVVPEEWEGTANASEEWAFCFWPGDPGPSVLDGPIEARVVAVKDEAWEPASLAADPMAEGGNDTRPARPWVEG